MRTKVYFCLMGVLLVAGLCRLPAQDVVSGVFGYYNLTLLGNSDTFVSIPFARLADSSITVGSATNSVVQAQTSPGWTAGQFVYASGTQSNTYYLRFDSGPLEGRYYDITNNTTNSVSINLRGDSLTNVAAGNAVSIVPYWTLGTVFVNGNGIVPSTSTILHNTEVLIPSLTNAGINLSASATYYYYTNSGAVAWRKAGSSATNLNDDILQPNAYLVIRQKVSTNTTFTSFGDVILTKVTIPLQINSSNKQDNAVGLTRPIAVSLTDSALIASGSFTPSVSTIIHKDELLTFDNTTTNFNKSVAATYYYYNSTWRKVGDAIDYSSSNILSPSVGFIIRKANAASSPLWTNTPTY